MRRLRIVGFLVALAAAGTAAFLGVRFIAGDMFVGAQDGGGIAPPPIEVLTAEARQPRFIGDKLGLFIAPAGVAAPDQYRGYGDICPNGATSHAVPLDQAGSLMIDLTLPPGFALQQDSDNTGAVACDGTVYSLRWHYTYKGSNGMLADVVIGRTPLTEWDGWDVAVSRVKTAEIAGHPAVVIDPATTDGLGSRSGVAFPGPFGMTFVSAANLSAGDLQLVAESVAGALGQ